MALKAVAKVLLTLGVFFVIGVVYVISYIHAVWKDGKDFIHR